MDDFIIENRILVRYTGKSKEVVIPKGVTIIGNKAFEVNLPESAKFIERRAFGYCKSLMTISIPEGMLMIDDEAFLGCGELIKTDRKRY